MSADAERDHITVVRAMFDAFRGVPIDQRFGQVWKFQDGKVKSLEWFASFDEALAAAGPRRDTS